MKWWVICSLLFVALAFAQEEDSSSEEEDRFTVAEECDVEACQLPDCRCSSTNIPGGLEPRDTPQFVTVTFDDGVNVLNIETYRPLLYGRSNSNGCPARATFFVNHEYTNYQLVNELYNNGQEIALHSITHQTPQSYWALGSYEDMKKEFADQKEQMSRFANIPVNQLKGVRKPFLQLSGNSTFKVMADYDLLYDSSWPTMQFQNPGLWPYTLDYASTQDCPIAPCPTASIPGVWVNPMIPWIDPIGNPCAMVDACTTFPDRDDENAWYEFILTNFERHYLGNRAPFGFYVHEWYISTYPAVRQALVRFLNLINNLEDAFMVGAEQVIEYVKDPVSINEYKNRPCRTHSATTCMPSSCGPLKADHNGLDYWLQVCGPCPNVYPWLGNPLGE